MKRILAVLALAASVFLAVSPVTATAKTTYNELCASKGTGLCATEWGTTSATAVVNDHNNQWDAQQIQTPYQSGTDCNGTVTATCPFYAGSGLNTRFQYDSIVCIWFLHSYGLLGTHDNGLTFTAHGTGSCGDNGSNWVRDGAYGYVNVWVTNQQANGSPYYLCTDGTAGDDMPIETYSNGYCQFDLAH